MLFSSTCHSFNMMFKNLPSLDFLYAKLFISPESKELAREIAKKQASITHTIVHHFSGDIIANIIGKKLKTIFGLNNRKYSLRPVLPLVL